MPKSIHNTFAKNLTQKVGFFYFLLMGFSLCLLSCAAETTVSNKKISIIKIDSHQLNLKQFLTLSQRSPEQLFKLQSHIGISQFTKKQIIKQFLEAYLLREWQRANNIKISSSQVHLQTKKLMRGYGDAVSLKQSLYQSNVSQSHLASFIRAKLLREAWIKQHRNKIKPIKFAEIKSFLKKKSVFLKPLKVARLQHLLFKTETDAQIVHQFLIQKKIKFSNLYKILPRFNPILAQKNIRVPQGASEIFNPAFKMKNKEISPVIKSSWGWHIYQVLKIEKNKKSLSKPFSFIKAILIEKKIDSLYQVWVKNQLKNKTVFINKKLLEKL